LEEHAWRLVGTRRLFPRLQSVSVHFMVWVLAEYGLAYEEIPQGVFTAIVQEFGGIKTEVRCSCL
jgi:hypothetical protein